MSAALVTAVAIRLLTYNVNYANPDPASAMDAIAAADADVVLLQEITPAWQGLLARRFARQYPYQAFHAARANGIAALAKHAAIREELLPAPRHVGGWFTAQRLVVPTARGAIQLLNVHLRPALDGDSWIRGFMTTPPIREREIAVHWAALDPSLPTIVAGDFNEDPTGLALAFLAKRGLTRVPTPQNGPRTWSYEEILRMDIDHVVVDPRHFTATAARVIDAGRSDHRPVLVHLELISRSRS
jgi:endonuclease/exonuclease/phosphatase (EEP) superfamily protein YafD